MVAWIQIYKLKVIEKCSLFPLKDQLKGQTNLRQSIPLITANFAF